jgi:hypothetical protein
MKMEGEKNEGKERQRPRVLHRRRKTAGRERRQRKERDK